MHAFASFSDTLLLQLAWTTVQASLLIGLLWLLGRALPRLPSTTRCLLWWLLGAQLLIGLAWQAPVRLPLLPAAVTATSGPARAAPTIESIAHKTRTTTTTTSDATAPAVDTTATGVAPTDIPWRQALVALWLAGLLVQLGIMARQWQRTRRIRATSYPLRDPHLQALCATQAMQIGLRHCPDLRVSDAIASPQVTGLLRPIVLLPARHALTRSEQAMALAHELTHLKRGDLWLGWIPTLAKTLFFFNPLVHLAVREYALHREAACDGQALRLQRAEVETYGQLLLRLGVERRPDVCMVGAASPTFRHLKRRLTMLQHTAITLPRFRDWLLVALVALAFVVPYRVVAASPAAQSVQQTVTHGGNGQHVPPPPPPPAPPPPPPPPPAPVPPMIPPPPPAPPAPPAPPTFGFHASNTDIVIDSDARFGLALFDGHSLAINGTDKDAQTIKRLKKSGQPMLWLRDGDNAWLSRDPVVIAKAQLIYAGQMQLARRQGLLSGTQGMLAGKQAALAARDGGFAARRASLAQRSAMLAQHDAMLAQRKTTLAVYVKQLATHSAAKDDAYRHAIKAQQQALAKEQTALAARRADLVKQQAKLKLQHDALETVLAKQRAALKERRLALQQQQATLAERQQQAQHNVAQQMQQLLEQAAANGKATRLHHD